MEDNDAFRVTNDLGEVPRLRERFVAAFHRESVQGETLEAWKLVFTELVCNAIEHGCTRPHDCVAVRWSIVAAYIELEVTDPGDCHGSIEELFEREETDFSETGRGAGLILVRHFMDDIEVKPVDGGGTRIRARRYRHRAEHGTDGGAAEVSA